MVSFQRIREKEERRSSKLESVVNEEMNIEYGNVKKECG